jgi:hypothetical protein
MRGNPDSEPVKKSILIGAALVLLPWSWLVILALGLVWIKRVSFEVSE